VNQKHIGHAETWLRENTKIEKKHAHALASLSPDLLQALPQGKPALVGIGGPPGSGKSTLAGMLCAVLKAEGRAGLVLSLDDYYLSRDSRDWLAVARHPLFSVRGVPGTHDTELLLDHLTRFKQGSQAGIALPRFDKSADDRFPASRKVGKQAPDVIFLEGWVIGAQPQTPAELVEPANTLEQSRDSNRLWRTEVNTDLATLCESLQPLIDCYWYLCPPDWDSVVSWRWQQEQELSSPALASMADTATFLAHFERLSRHMQQNCMDFASQVIDLDQDHLPSLRPGN
jgi:D-glycerate 3-kinase